MSYRIRIAIKYAEHEDAIYVHCTLQTWYKTKSPGHTAVWKNSMRSHNKRPY